MYVRSNATMKRNKSGGEALIVLAFVIRVTIIHFVGFSS